MRRFTNNEQKQMIELYQSGQSTVKIAKLFNSKAACIRASLIKNDIKLRSISESMRNIYHNSNEERDKYRKLLKDIKNHFYSFMWKAKVAVRDDFTCQKCFISIKFDGNYEEMHVDHIKSFSSIFKDNKISSLKEALNCPEFWDVNNGRCLCKNCHKKTDNYGKKEFKKTM